MDLIHTHWTLYLTVDCPIPLQRWTRFKMYFHAICSLLGITGKQGHPRLEVCPRFPGYLHTRPHFQVFTNAPTHKSNLENKKLEHLHRPREITEYTFNATLLSIK